MTRSRTLRHSVPPVWNPYRSTVAGLYAGYLRGTFPAIAGHLMSASILTIPAAFVMAKILVPEKIRTRNPGQSARNRF